MSNFRKILISIESCTYLLVIVIAILSLCGVNTYWDDMQSKTIIVGAIAAMVGVWATVIIEKITDFRFSILIDVCIAVDMFLGIIAGECLQAYYAIDCYDKILHFIGTFQIAILGYSLFKMILRDYNKGTKQVFLSILFGFFFGIAIEAIWEIYEWGADCLFGTNMQKYIPENFLNHLNSDFSIAEELKDDVAAFYSTKDGYHYAVMDTMGDIVVDCLGSLTGCLSIALIFRKWPELQDRLIYRKMEVDDVFCESEDNSEDLKN